MPMKGWPNQPIQGGPEAIAQANIPGIRLFIVKKHSVSTPQNDCEGTWLVCSPETVPNFSAVGYFFGRKLYDEMKIPIGLIHTSWGGSNAEAWIRSGILSKDAEFEPMAFKCNNLMNKWENDVQQAQTNNKEVPKQPVMPQHCLSYLYNGMINPLIPYTIKGVIWYQGESNVNRGYQYAKLFPTLIQNWRQDWGYQMPFYFVQLASFVAHKPTEVVEFDNSIPVESHWAELREAQLKTLTSTEQTGMAVTIDVGAANSVHPGDKKAVGQRLAYWALAKNYGKQIPYSGPLYKSMTVEKTKKGKLPYSGKNVIRVKFDYADSGLIVKGKKLKGMAIAGIDRKFVWADAMIEDDELVIWSDNIEAPVAVRYGWSIFPECNLYNNAGFPASPFRTDTWLTLRGTGKSH
jgi:sialate O-acetylesterase